MQRFLAIMILPLIGLVLPGSAQETIPSSEDPAGQEEPLDFLDGLNVGDLGGIGSMGDSDILLSGTLKVEQGGRNGKLEVKATLAPHWHTYAMDQEGGPGPSKIAVKSADKIEMLAPFRPDRQPKVREVDEFDVPLREHYEEVVWSAPVRLAEGVDAETLELEAQFDGLICNDATGCKPIFGRMVSVAFGGYYEPTEADLAEPAVVEPEVAEPAVATATPPSQGLDLGKLEAGVDEDRPVALILLIAFAAGLILNFMPCVLPVIGLKVMAFVQQAGDSRARAFALNLWYSLGVMTVFMVLATMLVVFEMKWAAQFNSTTFNVVLASIVFVFALSFLGVWEIPIPGFVGTGKAQELAEREGVAAAFLKGILATVLATPCAGPLVVPAFAWAVSQPPLVAYGGFALVGLGMASPYLVIGLFPRIISFLPKPGAWMETFKHIMGFVLLGTVVWVLTLVSIPYVIPAVAFIMGLWAAFWWIGRTPLTEPLWTKLRAWIGAGAFATLIGLVSFAWLAGVMESRFRRVVDEEVEKELATRNVVATAPKTNDDEAAHELPWQRYSLALLQKLTAEGKTVFVDFTADS